MTVVKFSETQHSAPAADLSVARRVIEAEIGALQKMMAGLGDSFTQAVDLIAQAQGRVIVSGVGKSGHVGKKIAATLASTGTPAFFVHPAEASHGDLGMIVRGDVVLALSNSGESRELQDIVAYAKRGAIPIIGITSQAASTLGERSDIALLVPPEPEACPNGLAPTTSTAMAMALGDALAIALLERKGFTARDFKDIHPGGKLGQQLKMVGDVMQSGEKMPLLREDASMAETVRMMTEKNLGCALVVAADGRLSGIVTDGDLRRNLFNDKSGEGLPSWLSPSRSRRWRKSMPVSEIMCKDPRAIAPTMLVGEAIALMSDIKNQSRRVMQMPVVGEDGKPVGILHIHDCLRAGFV